MYTCINFIYYYSTKKFNLTETFNGGEMFSRKCHTQISYVIYWNEGLVEDVICWNKGLAEVH